MTARAVACGSTPTLAQVSVGQARWSPPAGGPVQDRVDELAGEHHPVGSSASPITSVRSRGPTTSTGSPKPTRTSSGPSMPMVTSLATSAILPG
jgi:hypothetical protein